MELIFKIWHILLQIGFKNQSGVDRTPLTLVKAVQLVKDVFISAAERDIYTGDAIFINIITSAGIQKEEFPLRRDWSPSFLVLTTDK